MSSTLLAKMMAQKAAKAKAAEATTATVEAVEETVDDVIEEDTAEEIVDAVNDVETDVEVEEEEETSTKATKSVFKESKTSKEEKVSTGKKDIFQSKKGPKKEPVPLKEGAVMPRDVMVAKFTETLENDPAYNEKYAVPPQAAIDMFIRTFERFMLEDVLPKYQVNLFGARFKHSKLDARIYKPNDVLERVKTPYHTMASAHTVARLAISFDKKLTRGTIIDNEFIEGKFEEDGTFVPGTWEDNEFTPA